MSFWFQNSERRVKIIIATSDNPHVAPQFLLLCCYHWVKQVWTGYHHHFTDVTLLFRLWIKTEGTTSTGSYLIRELPSTYWSNCKVVVLKCTLFIQKTPPKVMCSHCCKLHTVNNSLIFFSHNVQHYEPIVDCLGNIGEVVCWHGRVAAWYFYWHLLQPIRKYYRNKQSNHNY